RHIMADTLLLVDDDASVLRAIGDYFERVGYEVWRDGTGEQAMDTFHRVRPDVVLLDLHLPDASGLTVLERLRREGAAGILLAASERSTVLLSGESGTGKGWVARVIHNLSPRSGGPFVEVNCAGLSATFLDSELFGHEKGAYTDAKERKVGLFELADHGTIFLDEIGELTPELQPKLLKVLETKKFRRLSGTRELSVDVRLIAATNRDLVREVEAGRFREDLYYRLNVMPLTLPPV